MKEDAGNTKFFIVFAVIASIIGMFLLNGRNHAILQEVLHENEEIRDAASKIRDVLDGLGTSASGGRHHSRLMEVMRKLDQTQGQHEEIHNRITRHSQAHGRLKSSVNKLAAVHEDLQTSLAQHSQQHEALKTTITDHDAAHDRLIEKIQQHNRGWQDTNARNKAKEKMNYYDLPNGAHLQTPWMLSDNKTELSIEGRRIFSLDRDGFILLPKDTQRIQVWVGSGMNPRMFLTAMKADPNLVMILISSSNAFQRVFMHHPMIKNKDHIFVVPASIAQTPGFQEATGPMKSEVTAVIRLENVLALIPKKVEVELVRLFPPNDYDTIISAGHHVNEIHRVMIRAQDIPMDHHDKIHEKAANVTIDKDRLKRAGFSLICCTCVNAAKWDADCAFGRYGYTDIAKKWEEEWIRPVKEHGNCDKAYNKETGKLTNTGEDPWSMPMCELPGGSKPGGGGAGQGRLPQNTAQQQMNRNMGVGKTQRANIQQQTINHQQGGMVGHAGVQQMGGVHQTTGGLASQLLNGAQQQMQQQHAMRGQVQGRQMAMGQQQLGQARQQQMVGRGLGAQQGGLSQAGQELHRQRAQQLAQQHQQQMAQMGAHGTLQQQMANEQARGQQQQRVQGQKQQQQQQQQRLQGQKRQGQARGQRQVGRA
eukprot:TRINITY_DN66326_c4_g1_i1.p1 TRINITY_DN66326_c4_g1~~TRINITY_DN66326_c4_g1_i1.p1  ORF type:complete len:657 (-),score=97.72 TRINITY_DN66326_c4_g1_i1:132-2075(-)